MIQYHKSRHILETNCIKKPRREPFALRLSDRRWFVLLVYASLTVYAAAVCKALLLRPGLFDYGQVGTVHVEPFSWKHPYANLQPFFTIGNYLYKPHLYGRREWIELLYGNLVLFFPFGLLLPIVSRAMRNCRKFGAALLMLLVAVELAQKYSLAGFFDIDDIILNAIGGFGGYAVYRALRRYSGL